MGRKGPLTFVSLQEFKERTSLRMSSRSPLTLKLDAAYAAFLASDTEYKRKQLYTVLQEYRTAHGGSWSTCERDKVSGGLIEWLYNEVSPPAMRMTPRRAAELDRRAREAIENTEIPHSRLGVLYFLGNIQIEMDYVSVAIEGVSVAGGAIGSGVSTTYGNLGNSDASQVTAFTDMGHKVTGQHLTYAGQGVLSVAKMASTKAGTVGKKPPPEVPSPSWFPCTEAALNATTASISDTYDHNKYFGVAAGVGAAVVAVPVLATTLVADAGIGLVRAGQALWDMVKNAVKGVINMLKEKFRENSTWFAEKSGTLLKMATKLVLDIVLKQAVPFAGSLVEVGTGLVRAIDDACTRIASYIDRRRIRLMPGHPEETANTIEHAMTMGLLKGVADILKGVGKTAAAVMAPGIGNLLSALMSALEWLVKFIYRMVEASAIEKFLERARIEYQEATQLHGGRAQVDIKKGLMHEAWETKKGVGIVNNTAEFTEFFKAGCDASPIIPMLTLNSGLCGSLMTLVKLFDDETGEMSHNNGGRQEFDIAGDFFHRLKIHSTTYLKTCGFQFKPLKPDDELLRGYLNHAVNKGHVEAVTVGRKLLAAARA